ncbi:MAG: DUF167 domain-containing protein [Candidatus Omnitrophica bacterium]|nr:DUF167 domain-containing protein [Candidatus Omnitrophota bacterium]
MKISVKVICNTKQRRVIKDGDMLRVWVDAPAVEGKANKRLLEILAEYYHKPKTAFTIKSGLKSKKKIIEIL